MRSNIWKLKLIWFFRMMMFFGAVSVPYFIDWIGVDYTKIFLLQTWFIAWVFLLEVPTGVIADKYGRKTSIILSMLFAMTGLTVFGVAREYYLMFLGDFLLAVSVTLFSGADKALLYDTMYAIKEKNTKRHMARYEAIGTFAMALSFPLGSLLAGSSLAEYPQTLPLTFLATAGSAFISFLFALSLKEPKRHKDDKELIRAGIDGFLFIFKKARLRVFALNSTLVGAATFLIFWFYQSLLQRVDVDIMYFGVVSAGFNLFAALLVFKVEWIEKFFGMRRTLFWSGAIPGILLIIVGFLESVALVILSIFFIAGLKLLRQPILIDFMNKHITSKNRATVLSGVSMVERGMIGVMYPFVGFFADISLTYALVGLGIVTIVFAYVTRIEASNM